MHKLTILVAAAMVTLSVSDGAHAQQAAARQLGAKTAEQAAGASRGAIVGARVGARAIYGHNTLYRIHGTNAAKSIGRPAGSAEVFKYSNAMKAKKAK